MLESENYFAIYSETKNWIWWKVTWCKWHHNQYTETVTVIYINKQGYEDSILKSPKSLSYYMYCHL